MTFFLGLNGQNSSVDVSLCIHLNCCCCLRDLCGSEEGGWQLLVVGVTAEGVFVVVVGSVAFVFWLCYSVNGHKLVGCVMLFSISFFWFFNFFYTKFATIQNQKKKNNFFRKNFFRRFCCCLPLSHLVFF